jgi:hypothetical protein
MAKTPRHGASIGCCHPCGSPRSSIKRRCPGDVPVFYQRLVRNSDVSALDLRYLILTALRTGEARFATIDESIATRWCMRSRPSGPKPAPRGACRYRAKRWRSSIPSNSAGPAPSCWWPASGQTNQRNGNARKAAWTGAWADGVRIPRGLSRLVRRDRGRSAGAFGPGSQAKIGKM